MKKEADPGRKLARKILGKTVSEEKISEAAQNLVNFAEALNWVYKRLEREKKFPLPKDPPSKTP